MISSEKFEHIINFESKSEFANNINRPLSTLFETIKLWDLRENIKIGLMLCHGHNYPNDIYTRLRFVNYWYMIDIKEFCFPDYICDVNDSKQLEYFPDNIFDYILDASCSVNDKIKTYDKCKRILKSNGKIIIGGIFSFQQYLNDDILGKINETLINDKPDVIECLNSFDREKWFSQSFGLMTENQKIWYILFTTCYPIKSKFIERSGKPKKIIVEPELIKQIRKIYSKKIFNDRGYKYIKEYGPYLSKSYIYHYIFIKPK